MKMKSHKAGGLGEFELKVKCDMISNLYGIQRGTFWAKPDVATMIQSKVMVEMCYGHHDLDLWRILHVICYLVFSNFLPNRPQHFCRMFRPLTLWAWVQTDLLTDRLKDRQIGPTNILSKLSNIICSYSPAKNIWLGGKRYAGAGLYNFTWLRDAVPVDYVYGWVPGEPHSGTDKCLRIGTDRKWLNNNCNNNAAYLCQYPWIANNRSIYNATSVHVGEPFNPWDCDLPQADRKQGDRLHANVGSWSFLDTADLDWYIKLTYHDFFLTRSISKMGAFLRMDASLSRG